MSTPRPALVAVTLALAGATGCGELPTTATADGSCIAVVNVHGTFFGTPGTPRIATTAVAPDAYLRITRSTGCLDEGSPSAGLASGESNFLPVGTTLHRVDGYPSGELLAYWNGTLGEWRPLAPFPES